MMFGNRVIDQDVVTVVSGAPQEAAAIYDVTAGGISKVWFAAGSWHLHRATWLARRAGMPGAKPPAPARAGTG